MGRLMLLILTWIKIDVHNYCFNSSSERLKEIFSYIKYCTIRHMGGRKFDRLSIKYEYTLYIEQRWATRAITITFVIVR